MLLTRRTFRCALPARYVSLAGAATAMLASAPAHSHFVLEAPDSSTAQDASGNPQKSAPCGDDSAGSRTGKITAYRAGQTITITIREVVFHPGHYRVALATHDRSELPPDPPVTAGATPCGSAPIEPSPSFPVLVDGALPHTSAMSGSQSIQVTLPPDVTCEECTLQIIEFMSNHALNVPGGCYYHHCADISIAKEASGADGGQSDTGTRASGGDRGGDTEGQGMGGDGFGVTE